MLAGQIYHVVISIYDNYDLDQSPVLRLVPKLIGNRATRLTLNISQSISCYNNVVWTEPLTRI